MRCTCNEREMVLANFGHKVLRTMGWDHCGQQHTRDPFHREDVTQWRKMLCKKPVAYARCSLLQNTQPMGSLVLHDDSFVWNGFTDCLVRQYSASIDVQLIRDRHILTKHGYTLDTHLQTWPAKKMKIFNELQPHCNAYPFSNARFPANDRLANPTVCTNDRSFQNNWVLNTCTWYHSKNKTNRRQPTPCKTANGLPSWITQFAAIVTLGPITQFSPMVTDSS